MSMDNPFLVNHFQRLVLKFVCPFSKYIYIFYRSGDWELAGPGEKETITQKFRRLQLELNELSEEIAAIKVKDLNCIENN